VSERPAVLVMARAPLPGRCKARLEPRLGAEGCARLQAALIRRGLRWASATGDAFVAYHPPGAEAAVAPLAEGCVRFPQRGADLPERLTAACADVLARHAGPLVLVSADVPELDRFHADAALGDLAAGCDVVIGPTMDGGCYLLGLAAPQPALLALPPSEWHGAGLFERGLAAARERGLSVAMMAPERQLDTLAALDAALADPLYPPDVLALLR
jgi:glycosyltransferase A (GT-A) superfamily protein (DUF2064 family)